MVFRNNSACVLLKHPHAVKSGCFQAVTSLVVTFVMWIHLWALHLRMFDYFWLPPPCSLPPSMLFSFSFHISYNGGRILKMSMWICHSTLFFLHPSQSKWNCFLASYRIHAADFSPGFKDKGPYINILKYRAIKTPMNIWWYHHYALHHHTK